MAGFAWSTVHRKKVVFKVTWLAWVSITHWAVARFAETMAVRFPESATTNNQLSILCWGFWTVRFWFYVKQLYLQGIEELWKFSQTRKKKVMFGIIARKNAHRFYFKGEFHYLVTQGMYFLSTFWLTWHSRSTAYPERWSYHFIQDMHPPSLITCNHVISSANWSGILFFLKR